MPAPPARTLLKRRRRDSAPPRNGRKEPAKRLLVSAEPGVMAAPILYAGELAQDGWRGMRRLLGKPVTGVALGAILALTVAGRTYLAVRGRT